MVHPFLVICISRFVGNEKFVIFPIIISMCNKMQKNNIQTVCFVFFASSLFRHRQQPHHIMGPKQIVFLMHLNIQNVCVRLGKNKWNAYLGFARKSNESLCVTSKKAHTNQRAQSKPRGRMTNTHDEKKPFQRNRHPCNGQILQTQH